MLHKRILCISPHADDMEHGCGGSISKFMEEGAEIYCVSFTFSPESIPFGFPKDITEKEFNESMNVFEINNRITFKYPVRNFPEYRQEILENLVRLNKEIKPNLVFIPSSYDMHQDHNTIYNEAFRAFKDNSILGYEMPRNNKCFVPSFFITLNKHNIDKKIEALLCYKSQLVKKNFNVDSLIHLAELRGYQVGVAYAECFENIRFII
jgi:LmbE family N-acetylglucosaminyl deacetylase